jgi:hypothetical protein
MRQATASRARSQAPLQLLPNVPLLEATDLPDDDWTLPGEFMSDDGFGEDDRFATLNVSRSFDD